MTAHTGRFKDPQTPTTRLYGEVLSTKSNLHFVKVTRRNAQSVTPYNTIVPVAEFTTLSQPDTTEFVGNEGANSGYWRQQLRGSDGRFIEMGGGIEWTDSEGNKKIGVVEGFDDEIEKVIVKDTDGDEYKLSADEVESSAVKAVLPEDEEEEDSEFDLDELLTSLDNEPVDLDEFLGDESKFPVGGPPLEIKDKQGKPVANLHKKKDSNGNISIILELIVALLPHEISRLFRNLNREKR